MSSKVKRRVLIAGGAGFLGSHLADRLIGEGHEVLVVDNFFTGSKDNLRHLFDHPRFEWMRHDICEPLSVEVDEIYNFACPASPLHYQADPIQTLKTSVIGTYNLLELAKRLGCKLFQASTSEVYGDPQVHPQPEEYWGNVNPIGLRSCYDEGKRCAETLLFDYHRAHQIPIKVGRIFNTYGPRMHPNDGRVVSNFIVQALTGQPLTMYGNGMQTRSFCYVDDLIEVICRFMATPETVIGPINIGNPEEFRVVDLAKIVLRLTGSSSPIVSIPLPADDPRQRRPDITRAKEWLHWAPTVAIEEGLKQTIAHFEVALTV
jgi:UDP-glucuronate decarboxylase